MIPSRSATETAMLEGAETAHTIGTPATAAFCRISKLVRPETSRIRPASGSPPSSRAQADQFVHGIVAADVFAEGDQAARRVEEARRMQAAGAVEDGLGSPHGAG